MAVTFEQSTQIISGVSFVTAQTVRRRSAINFVQSRFHQRLPQLRQSIPWAALCLMKIAQLPVLDSYQTKSTVIGDVKARSPSAPKEVIRSNTRCGTTMRDSGSEPEVCVIHVTAITPRYQFRPKIERELASETTYPSSLRKKYVL